LPSIVIAFLVVLTCTPAVQIAQNYTPRQLKGFYSYRSGGNSGTVLDNSTTCYRLYVRPWKRFVLKEKANNVTYYEEGLFKKKRRTEWKKSVGKWHIEGDSLMLKYSKRDGVRQAFKIELGYDYKVLNIWKIYRVELSRPHLRFSKRWKGDYSKGDDPCGLR
jgi:hypothetical protein